MYRVPKEIIEASRELRRLSTQAEKLLWNEIRSKKLWYKFTRQHPIYAFTEDSGHHRFVIPDFYCAEFRFIIELDWSIHDIPEVLELDKEKELLLENLWYSILRFTNSEVQENIQWVLFKIKSELKKI